MRVIAPRVDCVQSISHVFCWCPLETNFLEVFAGRWIVQGRFSRGDGKPWRCESSGCSRPSSLLP